MEKQVANHKNGSIGASGKNLHESRFDPKKTLGANCF